MSGWAALAGVGSSLFNSALGYYFDKKLMAKQFEYQKEVLQNQLQWRVDDLRAAGLNPILAGDFQGNAISGVTIPSGKEGKLDLAQSLATAKQMDLMDSQQQKVQADTDLSSANADQVREQTAKIRAEREALERENKFWANRPDQYAVKQGQQTIPWIGGFGEMLTQASRSLSNTAKEFDEKKKLGAKIMRKRGFNPSFDSY